MKNESLQNKCKKIKLLATDVGGISLIGLSGNDVVDGVNIINSLVPVELKYRKISDYNIKLALEEISNVEYIKIFNIISSKKIESLKKFNTQEKKQKLLNFLTYKGWEKEMIYEKLNSV